VIDRRLVTNFDWTLISLVRAICLVGILNIYSASAAYKLGGTPYYIKQLNWMAFGLLISLIVASLDYHILEDFSYWFYCLLVILLLAVLLVGKRSLGATRWLNLGFFTIQPSELMKIVIIVTFARFFNNYHTPSGISIKELLFPLALLVLPVAMIMKQPDLGTAILVILIALTMAVYVGLRWSTIVGAVLVTIPMLWVGWSYLLKPYQKNRVLDFINPERSRLGSGYHIIQSKIAVGSGGFWGKGFLGGTQTKFNFVPEQSTDFIFCTVGEEWGFAGSFLVILLFVILLLRLIVLAERQREAFSRIYGYCVVAILFFHISVNIGMTIGLFPVIGIPLPFFSYGGSSLWAFTILLFIFLKLDSTRLG